MLTARVDIIAHTSDTVDIQVAVFPTAASDPMIGSVDILDNSSPPLSLLGRPAGIPDCGVNFGVDPRFPVLGIPLTRLPIQIHVTLCNSPQVVNLGTFLQEMSPQTGAVPCSGDVDLPPSQHCRDAQDAVNNARSAFLDECTAISDARGRRDGAIAGAAATGATGVAAAATAGGIVAAIIQASATIATASAAAAAAAATVIVYGWIIAAIIAAIAVALLIALAIFLNNYRNAQNDLDAAYQQQVRNLQTFHHAVDQVRVMCCPQQVPSTLNLDTPTCP